MGGDTIKAFHVVVSELVREDALRGDEEASERRSAMIATLPILEPTDRTLSLAEILVLKRPLPREAGADGS